MRLSLGVDLLNHSPEPNATSDWDEDTGAIVVRTLRPLTAGGASIIPVRLGSSESPIQKRKPIENLVFFNFYTRFREVKRPGATLSEEKRCSSATATSPTLCCFASRPFWRSFRRVLRHLRLHSSLQAVQTHAKSRQIDENQRKSVQISANHDENG